MHNYRHRFEALQARTGLEFPILAALGGLAAALYAFSALVDEVGEGGTRAFDTAILLALRDAGDTSRPIGPWWLEVMFRDLTSLGSTAVLTLITIIAIGYLLIDGKRAAALVVFVAIGGGTILSFLLKLGFDRPRPDLVAHAVDVYTTSFPSSHAMLSTVTYLTLGALLARLQERRRLKIYIMGTAAAIALLIGFSRVFLGVHWPTDVLAGWCVGAAWALGCWVVTAWLQRRGKVEAATEHDESEKIAT